MENASNETISDMIGWSKRVEFYCFNHVVSTDTEVNILL